ncbi:SGNH/GDSL hydrolase family protein [Isosphaeraceae bacterium EP7]
MKRTTALALALAWLATSPAQAAGPAPIELKDGDRVVLVGGTFVERDQSFGYFETEVTRRNPGKSILFRNLGWSGDTVWGESRAGFGTAEDGFRQLKGQVALIKPTLILVHYGANESFAGSQGLPHFVEGLDRLLDMLAETKARIALVSPIRAEDLGRPLPDPSRHNADLALYSAEISKVAARRGLPFVDILDVDGSKLNPPAKLTQDEIQLNALGSWLTARTLADRAFGAVEDGWQVELEPGKAMSKGAEVAVAPAPSDGWKLGPKFRLTDAVLAAPASPAGGHTGRKLAVKGLDDSAKYTLKVDGKALVTANGKAWAAGIAIEGGPDAAQVETLRSTIGRKNSLYFYRWRPQNETYLFGFRKHEQGNNAREIPMFDPLVAEQESAIAGLRVPTPRTYELVREGEVKS